MQHCVAKLFPYFLLCRCAPFEMSERWPPSYSLWKQRSNAFGRACSCGWMPGAFSIPFAWQTDKEEGQTESSVQKHPNFFIVSWQICNSDAVARFWENSQFGNKDLAKRVTSMTRSVRWTAKHTYCYCYDVVTADALSLTVCSLHFRNGRKTSAVCNIV